MTESFNSIGFHSHIQARYQMDVGQHTAKREKASYGPCLSYDGLCIMGAALGLYGPHCVDY